MTIMISSMFTMRTTATLEKCNCANTWRRRRNKSIGFRSWLQLNWSIWSVFEPQEEIMPWNHHVYAPMLFLVWGLSHWIWRWSEKVSFWHHPCHILFSRASLMVQWKKENTIHIYNITYLCLISFQSSLIFMQKMNVLSKMFRWRIILLTKLSGLTPLCTSSVHFLIEYVLTQR